MQNSTSRKPLIIVAILCIFLVIGLISYGAWKAVSSTHFRLVSAQPSGTLPTSTDTLSFDFNRTLLPADKQPSDVIKIQPEYKFTLTIHEKTLQIVTEAKQLQGTKFVVSINGLKAENGETLSKELSYDVKFVPFNELSKAERQRQVSVVGTPQDQNPLLSQLPYDAIAYKVTYVSDDQKFGTASGDWKAEKNNYEVTVTTFALKDGTNDAFIAKHKALREDAKNWIRSLGVDPDKDIRLKYSPTDEELATGQVQNQDDFTGDGAPPANSYNTDTIDTTSPYPAD